MTGHTGFKGSWLSIWLKELGANVIGYSLDPPTSPSNFKVCNLQDHITHVCGDVRDIDLLFKVFDEHKPEIVFHLAAQPIVRESYINPKLTFDINIGGTVNLLEAVRCHDCVEVFVNITSDKCYENKEWIWGYREIDPMGGHDPYSASKGCCELVFAAYMKSFFTPSKSNQRKIGIASVRAGNVIGGGDWAIDRLIPDCVRALEANETICLRNPESIRPWQHVLEPLGGYLVIGARLLEEPFQFSGAWNFGPNDSNYLPVKKVVGKFLEFWGHGNWQDISDKHEKLHEAKLLRLSCDKAKTFLNYSSILSIEECLQFTVEWYKKYCGDNLNKNLYNYCAQQISTYMEKNAKRDVLK